MTRKTVLVTGSNGLLGQKLTDLYRKLDAVQLIATGTGPDRYAGTGGYEYVEMDITDAASVEEVFSRYSPQTVINAAAMTNVDACETDREHCDLVNITGPSNLAKACTAASAHLIHISTDFVFPGTKKLYTEVDEPQPLSYYGKSKWEGEKEVMANATEWSILRTIIVFGVAKNLSRSNTVLWAYNVLKDQAPAKVVTDQFRTPTLAEDLAMGCRLVEDKAAMGLYNISGKDFMSIYELVERVAKHFHFGMGNIEKISSASLNQPAKRPPVTGLDISKARKELGYEPHGFEEALDIFVKQLEEAK